jgi:hypothetical protein
VTDLMCLFVRMYLCADADEAKPTSGWRLRSDACLGLKGWGESIEAAGRRMFEDAKVGEGLTDMEFVLDSGLKIWGHKCWLMARCEYFRGMMSSGMVEVNTGMVRVRECSYGAFLALLEFIYTGKLGDTCQGQDWGELWGISDLFGLEEMSEGLLYAVTIDNVDEALRFALEREIKPLLEKCANVLPKRLHVRLSMARSTVRAVEELCVFGDADGWELVGRVISPVLDAMMEQTEDEIVQEVGCLILRQAACTFSDYKRRYGHLRILVLHRICAAIRHHVKNIQVQENSCRILSSLFDENYPREARQAFVGKFGENVKAIVKALKHHKSNALVQEHYCSALSYLCHRVWGDVDGCRTVQRSAGRAGGVEAVVAALNNHRANAAVQRRGCEALRWLVSYDTDDSNLRRAFEAEGAEAVVEALKAHRADVGVQEQGCAALSSLYAALSSRFRAWYTDTDGDYDDDDSLNVIFRLVGDAGEGGEVRAAVEAINVHQTNAAVAKAGLDALTNIFDLFECKCLMGQIERLSVACRASVAGGLEAILEVLRAHKMNAEIQESGCGALSKLCNCDREISDRAAVAGAVEAVVEALTVHRGEYDVEYQGCEFFADLQYNDEIQRRVGDAGGVEAVVKVLKSRATIKDCRTHSRGCKALSRICFGNVENARRGMVAGGLEVVVRSLKTNEDDPWWAEKSCELICTLCVDAESVHRAVEAGGIEAVATALWIHSPRTGSCSKCDGLLTYCFDCFKVRYWNNSVRRLLCKVMSKLCADDEDGLRRFGGTVFGLEVIMESLKDINDSCYVTPSKFFVESRWVQTDDPASRNPIPELRSVEWQELCLKALVSLLVENDHRKNHNSYYIAMKLDVISALNSLIREHPDNETIQQHGRSVLKRMGQHAFPSVLSHFNRVAQHRQ